MNFPCKCGHVKDRHYDEDNDDQMINEGIGHCQEYVREGHHCSSCGYDPDDYCPCVAYTPDNLKYLEQIYDQKVKSNG